jgi:hypothetical protein
MHKHNTQVSSKAVEKNYLVKEKERQIKSELINNKIELLNPAKLINSQSRAELQDREAINQEYEEDLVPELGERLEKIHVHNQNVNTLDNLVTNFKKNLQYLQNKIEKKEKYKINNHLLCLKIQEFERENLKLRDDFML